MILPVVFLGTALLELKERIDLEIPRIFSVTQLRTRASEIEISQSRPPAWDNPISEIYDS